MQGHIRVLCHRSLNDLVLGEPVIEVVRRKFRPLLWGKKIPRIAGDHKYC